MFKDVTIGADIEVFLVTEDGQPVSAVGLIDGSKESPIEFEPGYGSQRDNVMAEFNIPPIQLGDSQGFADSIKRCLEHIDNITPAPIQVLAAASIEFPEDQLQTPEACEFGCSPFISLYQQTSPKLVQEETILVDDVGNFRFAGGHIHMGWAGGTECHDDISGKVHDVEEYWRKMFISSLCDVHLLLPSFLEDSNEIRRQYYGAPGKMRFKPYGVEYRSLSNYFVENEKLMQNIMDRLVTIFDYANTVSPDDYPTAIEQHKAIVAEIAAAAPESRLAMIEKHQVACRFAV